MQEIPSLTEADIDALYAQYVRPEVFRHALPSPTPVVVFVGAQPAAGKTGTVKLLKKRFAELGQDVAVITGDDYRQHHPAYKQLVRDDPIAMPNVTQTFSGPAVGRAIDEARERRVNVIIEGTYRDPATTFATMQRYAEAGYRTELAVIATSIHRSRLAAQTRYLDPIEAGRTEETRWTPRSALDRGYEESAKILTAARDVEACHTISVYNRDGDQLASVARDAQGQWPTSGDDPEKVCRDYRDATAPTREDYLHDLDTIETRATRLDVMNTEVQTTLTKLRAAADDLHPAYATRADTLAPGITQHDHWPRIADRLERLQQLGHDPEQVLTRTISDDEGIDALTLLARINRAHPEVNIDRSHYAAGKSATEERQPRDTTRREDIARDFKKDPPRR